MLYNEQFFYQKHKPYAITVCRIEPENNIHIILEVFSRKAEIFLLIVGNWKNSDYGLKLFNRYKCSDNIILSDPIYDAKKINFLRLNACIYVHGHSVGGTNPSLVEAMFLSLPIFAFDCIFNRYTTENQCIYWSNADELYYCITHYKNFELGMVAEKMKAIAEKRYKWEIIVSQYEKLFFNK